MIRAVSRIESWSILLIAVAMGATIVSPAFAVRRFTSSFLSKDIGSLEPVSVALGDFNGDGHVDFATNGANLAPGGVSVALGNGDGTFGPASDYAASGGSGTRGVVTAD